jgi:two-component system sensor kinase FixL
MTDVPPYPQGSSITSGIDSQASRSSLVEAILDWSEDAIIAKDLNSIITAWNRGAERLFGYTGADMIGQPITLIFPPDRVEEEAGILDRIRRGERIEHYETMRRHKDGRLIRVSVSISPIKEASGVVIGASKIVRDLTERDNRERRIQELQAELAHVQRLTELGQVVSALVHEVNQPLTAISNYLGASRRLIAAGNHRGLPAVLERIDEQTNRTRQVVQRIRDFVNKREVSTRQEDLAHVINEAVALTRASMGGKGASITVRVDPAAPAVAIDRIQVQQVLFNLMRNGIEAMQDQPRHELVVATGATTQEGVVQVSVADTGPGLPDNIRAKLFQPFVTTKQNGMGVGLSICRTIVESHGGRLWAADNPGGGTVFCFTLRAVS